MKKLLGLSLLAAIALSLPNCKPDTAKNTTDATARNPASPTEVKAQFDILRDSADTSWRRLAASDDKKLADARALLADLARQPGVNHSRLDSLNLAVAQLKTLHYTRQSMAESASIDTYDTTQSAILHVLFQMAAPGGNAPTEPIRDYVEALQQADTDNAVVSYRVRYDRAAKAYNAYLQVHQDDLSKLGGQYAGLQPLPLFELSR